jgi:hypothetical protein
MRLGILAFLLLAGVLPAQESFKRLPELPKGLLWKKNAHTPVLKMIDPPGQSPCAVEMPHALSPGFPSEMPVVPPQSGQDQSRILNPNSPCKDKLLLLSK